MRKYTEFPVPRKQEPYLQILHKARRSIFFEKGYTEKKNLWRRKGNKSCLAWKTETEWAVQEKLYLRTQPSEVLTISLEARGQDRV